MLSSTRCSVAVRKDAVFAPFSYTFAQTDRLSRQARDRCEENSEKTAAFFVAGAVFATGSIAWAGALPINGYDNSVATITKNVIERFSRSGTIKSTQATRSTLIQHVAGSHHHGLAISTREKCFQDKLGSPMYITWEINGECALPSVGTDPFVPPSPEAVGGARL
jgi:hypothetical protein